MYCQCHYQDPQFHPAIFPFLFKGMIYLLLKAIMFLLVDIIINQFIPVLFIFFLKLGHTFCFPLCNLSDFSVLHHAGDVSEGHVINFVVVQTN